MLTDRGRLRLKIVVLTAISAAYVAMLIGFEVRVPLVVYNASGSAPLGFYYLENRLPGRGELAVFKPTPAIELLIIAHEILPMPVPLIKQVVAVEGDEVCRSNDPTDAIMIGGRLLAEVQATDHAGRPMPSWEGCLRLISGEYFLLQPHPLSFDSRYFGPVLRCDILGVARPLWTWNPDG